MSMKECCKLQMNWVFKWGIRTGPLPTEILSLVTILLMSLVSSLLIHRNICFRKVFESFP